MSESQEGCGHDRHDDRHTRGGAGYGRAWLGVARYGGAGYGVVLAVVAMIVMLYAALEEK